MDLLRYFQPVRGDALPDPKGPLSTTIPRQAMAEANKRVQEVAIVKASKKRGSYGHFDAKTRAAIGKYSCENGVVVAARYYYREGREVHLIAKYSNISHMLYGNTMQLGGCRCNWVK